MFPSSRFQKSGRAMAVVGWVLAAALAVHGGPGKPAGGLTGAQDHALGEQIYRKGILPSGKLMRVSLAGAPVTGSAFSCASCHTRSGLGTLAEGCAPCRSTARSCSNRSTRTSPP